MVVSFEPASSAAGAEGSGRSAPGRDYAKRPIEMRQDPRRGLIFPVGIVRGEAAPVRPHCRDGTGVPPTTKPMDPLLLIRRSQLGEVIDRAYLERCRETPRR